MIKEGYIKKNNFAVAFSMCETWTFKAGHKLEVFEKELDRKAFVFKDEILYNWLSQILQDAASDLTPCFLQFQP
jgi:hypothetical protein